MQYFSIYAQSFRSLRRLGPLRAGEVLYALMDYAESGTEPTDLDEGQMIIMDGLMDKLDRDARAYDAKCDKMKKLAQKRWHATAQSGNAQECVGMRTHATAQSRNASYQPRNASAANSMRTQVTKPNQTEPNQTKPNPTTTSTAASAPLMPPQDVADISALQDQVLKQAQDAGFPVHTAACMTQIIDLLALYGQETLTKGIQACVDNGVIKLVYLKHCCEGISKGISKPKPAQPAARGPRVLREQQFEQRQYEASTGLPDWMKAMMDADNPADACRQMIQRKDEDE